MRVSSSRSRKNKFRTFVFFKPYGVISQFTPDGGHQPISDFGPFPDDVYPVGRLDWDREGLLLLTNDNVLKHRYTDPGFEHPRTYFVQVEGVPLMSALQRLRTGIVIEGKKTKPATVHLLKAEPSLPPRPVPIRYRKNVPTAWLEMTITEGRNRQVRKMTAAVGHPTLRIVRVKIGTISLGSLKPGESRVLMRDVNDDVNLP